jgi:hypothetical protein
MSKKFKKDNYLVIKKAVSEDICKFAAEYLMLKRQVSQRLHNKKMIGRDNLGWGSFGDGQVPFSYNHYSDTAMEILLVRMKSVIENKIKKEIVPTYSYTRIYEHGDILGRHKDRYSCEISATLTLFQDKKWPIFVEPSGKTGLKGIPINLKMGDLMIYNGEKIEHWREVFYGNWCVQVFLHYNIKGTKKAEENKFDKRAFIGLPHDC